MLDALDNYIPEPIRDVDRPLMMPIENVFSIEGRGTVATGKIERGVVRVGDEVEIVGVAEGPRRTVCTSVESFGRILDFGQAGDNVGCLLRGVRQDEIARGQILAAPGSLTPRTRFEAEIYTLSKEEGGRHTPFFSGYSPQFFFHTADVTGTVHLTGGAEMCMPGETANVAIDLRHPVALDREDRFAIREGGRTVGSGAVTKIVAERAVFACCNVRSRGPSRDGPRQFELVASARCIRCITISPGAD